MPVRGYCECGGSYGLFYKVVGVEFVSTGFVVYGARNSLTFCLCGEVVAHVCLA